MQISKFSKILSACAASVLLAACGGGGSGDKGSFIGDSSDPLQLTLSAERTSFPLNISNEPAQIHGPYTTQLYISGKYKNGRTVEDGNSIGCVVLSDITAGALAYMDGEHTKDGVETLFRSIDLKTAGGGQSFAFHALSEPGKVTIQCTTQDTHNNGKTITASVVMSVGSDGDKPATTGKPSQILVNHANAPYLYAQGLNKNTQLVVQAEVLDSHAIKVPNPPQGTNNVYVRILDASTSPGALLRGLDANGNAVSGSNIKVRSLNGQASFTLISGTTTGIVAVETFTDYTDNNVDNGIAVPVRNIFAKPIFVATPEGPLSITTDSLKDGEENKLYDTVLLEAKGGAPAYAWSEVSLSGCPSEVSPCNLKNIGFSLDSTGVLEGTPSAFGSFALTLRVTDANKETAEKTFKLTIKEVPLVISSEDSKVPDVSYNTATPPAALPYSGFIVVTGGKAPYTYAATGLPTGLSIDSKTGIISGTPAITAGATVSFVVTVTDSSTPKKTVSKVFQIKG